MADVTAKPWISRRALICGAVAGGLVVSAGGGWMALARDRFDGDALTPPGALDAVRAGNLTLVDIRQPREWAETGIAAGAVPLDMRRDDFVDALLAVAGDRNAPIALICARGVRSDRQSARLAEAGFTRIIDVPEGMLGSAAGPGWLERGLPVTAP